MTKLERRMPIHPLLLYRCRSISSQLDFARLGSDANAPAAAPATHRVDGCEGCWWLACRAACLALHDIPPRLPHSLIFRLRLNDEKMRFQPIMSPAGIQSLSRFEVSKVRYRGKYGVQGIILRGHRIFTDCHCPRLAIQCRKQPTLLPLRPSASEHNLRV